MLDLCFSHFTIKSGCHESISHIVSFVIERFCCIVVDATFVRSYIVTFLTDEEMG
jgi:hypothetical protein